MSNTEHHTRPALQFHPKQLKRIINRAFGLIKDSSEPNATVRVMAETLIGDFADVVANNPKMTFSEGIMAAKLLSATPPNQRATWEHTCGSAMATSALELSAKIEMRTLPYGKALIQMNRTIAYRERTHEQRTNAGEIRTSSQHSRPTKPVSITERKPSRKRQPAKARRRRAA